MTDAARLLALLNIVDPDRTEDAVESQQLVVLGLAVRRGRGVWPTAAGWILMGDAGHAFDPQG